MLQSWSLVPGMWPHLDLHRGNKMRSLESRSSPNDWCPHRKGDVWTQRQTHMGRTLCEGLSDAVTNKPRDPQNLGERPRTDPSMASAEGARPHQQLDLRLLASRAERIHFCCLSHSVCCINIWTWNLNQLMCLPSPDPPLTPKPTLWFRGPQPLGSRLVLLSDQCWY